MACDFLRDENDRIIGISCGSPWGVGVYRLPEEYREEFGEFQYGFPPHGMNPEEFRPDRDSCTPAEIGAWEESLALWRTRPREEPRDG